MASPVPLFNGLKHLPCPKEAGGDACTTPGCLFGHRTDPPHSSMRLHQSLDGAADEDDGANGESEGPPTKRQKTASRPPAAVQGKGEGQDEVDGPPFTTASEAIEPINKIKASDIYDPLSPPTVQQSPYVEQQLPKPVTASSPLNKQDSTPLKYSASLASAPVPASPLASRTTNPGLEAPPASVLGKSTAASSSPPPLTSPSPGRGLTSTLATNSQAPEVKAASPSQKLPRPARKPESLNPRHLSAAPAAYGIRYKLLGLLHADYTRLNTEVTSRSLKDPELKALILSAQELIWMALDREQHLATERPALYGNAMRQEVMKYKKMKFDVWTVERRKALEKQPIQHKNPTIGAPVTINTGLTTDQEIEVLRRIVTPITNLEQYGYVPAPPSDEEIDRARQAVEWSKGWEQCDRCTARFQVFPGRNIETGELASGGQCTHHPGKLYFPERTLGDKTWVPKKYRCCNESVGESPGCAVAKTHVWKTSDPKRLASQWNFAETPANNSPRARKAVAFDCEMGHTVNGMELVRVTATDWPAGAELIDVLVQPYGEILDLNSKYSGVFPEDLARAVPWTQDGKLPPQQPGERKILQKVPSPEVARDLLFSLISPDTILIGHGLENDLNAMRMVHPQIADTILLYPHRRGLPIRNGLRLLMESTLNRRIQVDTGEGHDSAEDARAAGDLVRYKVEKEWLMLKSQGWKFEGGQLRSPGWRPSLQEKTSKDSVDAERGALLTEEFLEAGS